jgi:hypothetical protein
VGSRGLICAGCVQAALTGMSTQIEGECYEDLSVTVIDDETGAKVCHATVTLLDSNGETRELDSCYHASLREGRYRLQAHLPDRRPATTYLEVADLSDCKPVTATVVLTIPAM